MTGTSVYILLTGIVRNNPQLHILGDMRVARFSVMMFRDRSEDNKQVMWVQVNCWNKLADVAEEYVKRGALVQVVAEWLRLDFGIEPERLPEVRLDLDAQRLILLASWEDAEPESDSDMWF